MAQPTYKLIPFNSGNTPPDELYLRKAWIGWRAVWRPGKAKPDKIPVVIRTGLGDGYLEPANHVFYDEAVEAIERLKLSGVGFVLTKGCGLVGGDMDGCRDPATGQIMAWAQAIVDLNETYLEVSPSGQGIRFWALEDAIILRAIKDNDAGVEIYPWGRYLTFTGEQLAGSRSTIESATGTLRKLMDRVRDSKAARLPSSASPNAQPGAGIGTAGDLFVRKVQRENAFGRVKETALANLDKWVPELFPTAEFQPGTGAWRVRSADLGRGLEEDLSLAPGGIKDWGVHDLGDPKEGGRTAIDVVIEWLDVEPKLDAKGAAEWLAGRLGIPFGPKDPNPDVDEDAEDAWLAALARLRVATPRPDFITDGATDTSDGVRRFDPTYKGPVAARPTITDRLTRGYVSSVASAANAGKSTYLGDEAMAIVTERGDLLLGQPDVDWCGDALIVSNEESENVLKARWRGQMRALGVTAGDFRHSLDVWPTDDGKLVLGRGGRDKTVTPTLDAVRFVNWLAARAEAGEPLAFIGFDTMVTLFSGVNENGEEMDKAVGMLNAIASAGFLAIDVMQHQGKTGDKESIQAYRGSSAIFAALAEMSTLIGLTTEQGTEMGLDAGQSGRTLRLMGQRQRDGVIPAVYYFEREILSLTAEDPRDKTRAVMRTVSVLKPIATPVKRGAGLDAVWRALWGWLASGGCDINRGQLRGAGAADWAHGILETMLGLNRAEAETALRELESEGRIKTVLDPKDAKRRRRILEVSEPRQEGSGLDPF